MGHVPPLSSFLSLANQFMCLKTLVVQFPLPYWKTKLVAHCVTSGASNTLAVVVLD